MQNSFDDGSSTNKTTACRAEKHKFVGYYTWILDAFYIIPECTVQGHKPFQYKRGHWKLRGEGAGWHQKPNLLEKYLC